MRRPSERGVFWLLGLVAVVALLTGCGGSEKGAEGGERASATTYSPVHPKKLRVTLEGSESAQNVGVLMAAQRGYFKDLGLDVWVGSPLEPSRSAAYVAKRIDDLGVTELPQVVVGKEKGMPIVAVGSVVSHPTAAMIWLKSSKIDGIADLKGRTIAVPGVPFQAGFLQTVLERAGLTLDDVKLKRVGYELVPALLAGQADAIFGGSWNIEGAELESLGETPVITRVQDLGVPDYEELVVVARSDLVAEEPELIRDFMSAVRRGTAAAVADPDAALKVIRTELESIPPPDRKMMEAQVKATLPLLSKSGRMNQDRAQQLVDWMHEEGLIEREWPVGRLLTDENR